MAWFWMGVIVLLIPAYYGVYVYSAAVRRGPEAMTPRNRAVGWCSAAMFLAIGFLFVNAMSLTTNTAAWSGLWQRHSVGGAATGTALNLADATLWPRWLMMFGFALITTAAWTAVDTAWLATQESKAYKQWAAKFAFRLALLGAIWATLAGTWYVFGTWRSDVFKEMFAFPAIILTLATAASPWLPVVILWLSRGKEIARSLAVVVAGAQVGVLAINAISRQIVQNLELRGLFHPGVSAQPERVEWGPLVMFLAAFVIGVGVLVWMLAQLAKASPVPLREIGSEKV